YERVFLFLQKKIELVSGVESRLCLVFRECGVVIFQTMNRTRFEIILFATLIRRCIKQRKYKKRAHDRKKAPATQDPAAQTTLI
ncbi:hypothetical protein ACPDZ3_002582, partial [Escherichia coli]